MYLNEGSKTSFEVPKTDILRASYECLKHIEVYRNHKRLTGYTEKTAYCKETPFSQILSQLIPTLIEVFIFDDHVILRPFIESEVPTGL